MEGDLPAPVLCIYGVVDMSASMNGGKINVKMKDDNRLRDHDFERNNKRQDKEGFSY